MSGAALILMLVGGLSAVFSAIINDDGSVILTMDSFTKQDRDQIRVNATMWPGDHESYAGYVRVNADKDVNLFFWFCLAKTDKRQTAPVLLWLNGGPGRSSLMGALLANGPYHLTEDGTVVEREHAWTNEFNMLYVDSPVGVGYSFSSLGTIEDYMEDVARSLYRLLKHLNTCIFPDYFKKGLYIGGQSYAGKYIPHLGHLIHQKNRQVPEISRLPLQGIYLGNALCDPQTMFPVYPDSLYHAGLLSSKTRETYRAGLNDMIRETNEQGGLFDSDKYLDVIFGTPIRALMDLNHLLTPEHAMGDSFHTLSTFLNQPTTGRTLHAGDMSQRRNDIDNWDAGNPLLKTDFMNGTTAQNKLLMNNYKVLQYTGHLDMLVTVAMTDTFLDQVDWCGRDKYRESTYSQWSVGDRLAGWYATAGNFTRVIVRGSGHNVPFDQPRAGLDMMKRFVLGGFDQPFHEQRNRAARLSL